MLLRGGLGEHKPRRHPQHLLLWCLTLATLAIVCWAQPAHAYTWMIRHGYAACSSCHADPSGGELLSSYGRLEGDVLLRMQYGEPAEGDEEPDTGFLWGAVDTPDNLLLSGSFRNLNIYEPGADDPLTIIPIMMGDLYGQVRADFVRAAASAGISKVKVGSPHARAAQVTHGQGEQYNMVSRTHWLGFDLGADDNYLLRLGRMNLPFGVRVPEHTLWAREATRTDRESDQQHGAALAYTGETFRGEIMGIAGNFQVSPDKLRERGYSLFFEYLPSPELAIGASSLATFADEDRITLREDVWRQAHGLIGRAKLFDSLAVYGEADLLLTTDTTTGYTGFVQFDYELVQGLHFMVTGEVLDQGLAGEETDTNQQTEGRGKPRFGAWGSIDWFFYRQFELRLDAIKRQSAGTQLLAQLHFYL
ncbi:MAG TPA: hypothetical protein VI197_26275 [Polyangiaceae bacterium]